MHWPGRIFLFGLLAVTPVTAFAAKCYKHPLIDTIEPGCPTGYISLIQQNFEDDQAAADQLAADEPKIEALCADIEAHPAKWRIKLALKGASLETFENFCARAPYLEQEAAQSEAQEGIVPDASKAAEP